MLWFHTTHFHIIFCEPSTLYDWSYVRNLHLPCVQYNSIVLNTSTFIMIISGDDKLWRSSLRNFSFLLLLLSLRFEYSSQHFVLSLNWWRVLSLGRNAVWSASSQTFRRKVLPPCSGSKFKASKKQKKKQEPRIQLQFLFLLQSGMLKINFQTTYKADRIHSNLYLIFNDD
jgi:hypothetical protein